MLDDERSLYSLVVINADDLWLMLTACEILEASDGEKYLMERYRMCIMRLRISIVSWGYDS